MREGTYTKMSGSNSSLIVPMDVAALCVGEDDVGTGGAYGTTDFADLTYSFSKLPYCKDKREVQDGAFISDGILPQLFGDASPCLKMGIHLHWSLPSAIAHANIDQEGKQTIMNAPNRWIVVRTITDNSDPSSPVTTQKAWIIESDALWDDDGGTGINSYSRSVPIKVDIANRQDNKSFKKMGRVFDYEDWSGWDGDYAESNTMLGFGLPTFSASYRNCANVFGLYDSLDDLTQDTGEVTISYMVSGWYRLSGDDPLNYPEDINTNKEKIAYIKDTYHWGIEDNDDEIAPANTICNGLITSIKWDKKTKYVNKRENPDIEIAIGNTVPEALSAYLTSKEGGIENIEEVLNALQLGLLTNKMTLTGGANLDESIHKAEFSKESNTNIWMIEKKTSTGQEFGVEDVAVPGDELPFSLGYALNRLNDAQGALNDIALRCNSIKSQMYSDFYNYMSLKYPPHEIVPKPPVDAGEVFTYLGEEVDYLDDLKTKIEEVLLPDRESARIELEGELPEGYILKLVPSAIFYNPNEPVLLFKGDSLKSHSRHLRSLRTGKEDLACRLGDKLIDGMNVNNDNGEQIIISTGDLPHLADNSTLQYPADIKALVGEIFFLDEDQATVLAKAVETKSGEDTDALISDIKTAQNNLINDRSKNIDITFVGSTPATTGFSVWDNNPWIPIIMEWEVNYYPLYKAHDKSTYDHDFISSNYSLGPDDFDIDLQPTFTVKPDVVSELYQGQILLTDNVEVNILREIDNYIANFPDSDYVEELKTIRHDANIGMQAQGLSGFNQAMLMRDEVLELPVGDPLESSRNPSIFVNTKLPDAIEGETNSSPMPNGSYNPIRGGSMTVSRVRIVDAYGQTEMVEMPEVIVSDRLQCHDAPINGKIYIPPRITQPSRLLFRWISADDDEVEMNSVPATSPVCGWVLFNHLDNNLMLYSGEGIALGSLNIVGPLWLGAPGPDYEKSIEEVMDSANPHLKDFALGIYNNNKDGNRDNLKKILKTIDTTVTVIEPRNYTENTGLSTLIGRPLALTRTSIKLDLMGNSAFNQGFDALKDACDKGTDGIEKRDDGDFTSVDVPVRLGDLHNINDGLIGYFVEDDDDPFATMYAHACKEDGDGVKKPSADKLLLTTDKNTEGITLFLLMDPRANIHATTGILPIVKCTLPPEVYNNSLNNMAVTFLSTPIVGSPSTLTFPLPSISGYKWSWVSKDPGTSGWSDVKVSTTGPKGPLTMLPQQISEGWLELSKDKGGD